MFVSDHFTIMERLPSPGNSCGSPFSDVTSGSPGQYSDEPVSPDYNNIDVLRAEYSVSSAAVFQAGSAAQDSASSRTEAVSYGGLTDELFYQTLSVGTPDGIQSHCQHVVNRYNSGGMNLPTMSKLLDFTQPKKPSKEGAVKRPMNAFMCFSKMERRHLSAGQPELHNARISRHLGNVWRQCPEAVQTCFKQLAQSVKDLHMQEHPEYKYRPRKRKTSGGASSSAASSSSAPSAASSGSSVSEGPTKPAKSARKSSAKPRSRARKTSPAHVVPAATLPDFHEQLCPFEQLYRDAPSPPDIIRPSVCERVPAHPNVQPQQQQQQLQLLQQQQQEQQQQPAVAIRAENPAVVEVLDGNQVGDLPPMFDDPGPYPYNENLGILGLEEVLDDLLPSSLGNSPYWNNDDLDCGELVQDPAELDAALNNGIEGIEQFLMKP